MEPIQPIQPKPLTSLDKLINTVRQPIVFVAVLGALTTAATGIVHLLSSDAELKVRKEYDKMLTNYAIDLAICKDGKP